MGKAESQRKPNDDLMVMTHDGDLYVDPNVRQVMGLIVSDRNQWALPTVQAAPVNEFRRPDQPPVKTRAMFVYRNDPPPPQESAMVVNRILPAVEAMAARGQWRPYRPAVQRMSQWKHICALISTIAMALIAYQSYDAIQNADANKADERRARIEAAAASEPTEEERAKMQAEYDANMASEDAEPNATPDPNAPPAPSDLKPDTEPEPGGVVVPVPVPTADVRVDVTATPEPIPTATPVPQVEETDALKPDDPNVPPVPKPEDTDVPKPKDVVDTPPPDTPAIEGVLMPNPNVTPTATPEPEK